MTLKKVFIFLIIVALLYATGHVYYRWHNNPPLSDPKDKAGHNALSGAINAGDLEQVKNLVNHGFTRTSWGSPLDYAILAIRSVGPKEKIKPVISFLVDSKFPTKESPIIIALLTNNKDLVKALADTLDTTNMGERELRRLREAAMITGDPKLFDFLLHKFPNLGATGPEEFSLLEEALHSYSPAMVKYVLGFTNHNQINTPRNKRSYTPFQQAISLNQYGDNLEIIELLLQHGANLHEQDYEPGHSPFDLARDNPKLIELLQKYNKKM